MKKYFVVQVEYYKPSYMGKDERHNATHVVEASDFNSAYMAAKKHYMDQSVDYGVSYVVDDITIFEMIEGE